MAPLPFGSSSISGRDISSLEPESRSTSTIDLPAYLSSLSLPEREALNSPPEHGLIKRSPVSPLEDYTRLRSRDAAKPHPDPGAGSIDPTTINMKGFFALFAILGASLVIAAIWFFFWAKNGGFRWRKGDWGDYKSTVLRRKGPNGTTLSGATKSTALGGGSVVGVGYRDDDGTSQGMSEVMAKPNVKGKGKAQKNRAGTGRDGMKGQQKEERLQQQREERWEGGADNDVRAYRHEKPARVGGMNRAPDGSYSGTATDPSEWSHSQPHSHSRQQSPHKQQHTGHRAPSSSAYSFTAGSDDNVTYTPEDPRPLRYQNRNSQPQPPRQKQPRTSMPGSFADPLDFSETESNGTKSYYHHIPGLSPGKDPKKTGNGGFRRGGGRRRDSLSESEGEDSRM